MPKRSISTSPVSSREVSLVGKSFSSVFKLNLQRHTQKRRFRIAGSGVHGRPLEGRFTAAVVAALRERGIAVREFSMGSPANVDSFHLEATFLDGGLTAMTGAYWYSERGAWVTGEKAVDWVASILHLRPRQAKTSAIPPQINKSLLAAYMETDYVVHISPEVHIRINSALPVVADLLKQHSATNAVVITAWNPFSRQLPVLENEQRNADLLQAVCTAGLSHLSAEGRDPAGVWPSESSLIVFDTPAAVIDSWLIRFEQNAAVFVQASGMATLVLHPAHREVDSAVS